MEATRFSIITITRNNRAGLRKTAQSILHQTDKNYEWIIIDGASSDGTADDLSSYTSANVTSEPDRGIYDAMNKGIDRAHGDYLIFMNAGDEFAAPDILEKIARHTTTRPEFIYGDSREGGYLKHARAHTKILWGLFTHHQAMFYRRESLGTLRYNRNYKIAADYDLTLRFLSSSPLRGGDKGESENIEKRSIIYVPIPICVFEQGGVSQTNAKQGRDEQFQSRKNNKAVSTIKNHMIRTGQWGLWTLRTTFPFLYRIIRICL